MVKLFNLGRTPPDCVLREISAHCFPLSRRVAALASKTGKALRSPPTDLDVLPKSCRSVGRTEEEPDEPARIPRLLDLSAGAGSSQGRSALSLWHMEHHEKLAGMHALRLAESTSGDLDQILASLHSLCATLSSQLVRAASRDSSLIGSLEPHAARSSDLSGGACAFSCAVCCFSCRLVSFPSLSVFFSSLLVTLPQIFQKSIHITRRTWAER